MTRMDHHLELILELSINTIRKKSCQNNQAHKYCILGYKSFYNFSEDTQKMSGLEGLDGHKLSVKIRQKN